MAQNLSGLSVDLSEFEGRATTILTEIQAQYGDHPEFISELISLTGSRMGSVSDGATWLLKHNLENGVRLGSRQAKDLVKTLGKISTWLAQLHICQLLAYVDVPTDEAPVVVDWLSPLLQHRRPFIRAWSMSALFQLSRKNAVYADMGDAALNAAKSDPSASVRARARHLAG